jgi:thymidylate synthase
MDNFNNSYVHSLECLKWKGSVVFPRGLECKELIGHTFNFTNSRDRILFNKARKSNPFYMAGELLWYFLGSNSLDFISYYSKVWNRCSDDGKTLNSAYGHRIFKGAEYPTIQFNQFKRVIQQLKDDPFTRQAIIHLHTPNQVPTNDEVCTLCLQFFIRDNKLVQHVTMRSNDCIWGTTYDVYFFTVLQEIIANELKVECGAYYHTAGSFHIYRKDYELADAVVNSNNLNYLYDSYKRDIVYDSTFMSDLPLLRNVEEYYRLQEHISPVEYGRVLGISGLKSNSAKDIAMTLALYACYKTYKKNKPSEVKTMMKNSIDNLEPYLCKATMWLVENIGDKLWM